MRRQLIWLGCLLGVMACGGEDVTEEGPEGMAADTAAPPPGAGAAAGAVTDPQIAAIVVAANQADIEAGQLAQEKGTNPRVKQFGGQMVADHGASNQQANDLVTRLGVTPEENPTSQQLQQGGQQTLERLRGLSGAEFDRAYIDNEVTFHQTVLDAIDRTLLPNAQNAELKALLEQTRPVVEAHLNMAKEIQGALGAG